jgi:hypothetical protein
LFPQRRTTCPNGEWGYITRRHMLEPVRPEAALPDRALCLATFSRFLIVNKTSLSLSLSQLLGDPRPRGRANRHDPRLGPSWSAREREGDEPLEPKTGTRNVRWVSPGTQGVPLSCPATGSPCGTPPRPRLKTTTGGLPYGVALGPLKRSTQTSISLLTRTLPLALRLVRPQHARLGMTL